MQVEKSPVVIKSGLKKEEAEELKKKIEAGKRLLPHSSFMIEKRSIGYIRLAHCLDDRSAMNSAFMNQSMNSYTS